ncbi:hypothetical protein [Methanolobus sp. WCC4]|uniref:hypothetical protein n=1 Tax=Methanolobus sp. WCC4 TaxID=3125784 RepID=UPI0030F5D452
MALEDELIKIKESTVEELNDVLLQKIDDSLIDEYPATGMHQFYAESFEYKDYGYNIAINMFFNMEKFGEVCCCKDSLFLGVTPCQDSVVLCDEARKWSKNYSFLCFSQHIGKNNVNDVILDVQSKVRDQVNSLLKMQKSTALEMHRVR